MTRITDRIVDDRAGEPSRADEAGPASGSYRGEEVVALPESDSELVSAQAEQFAARHDRSEAKPLAHRTAHWKAREDAAAKMLFDKFVRHHLPHLANLDRVLRLVESFRKRDRMTPQEVLEEVQGSFADVSEQHAFIRTLEEWLARVDGRSPAREALRQAREQLERERGPEITAGYNIAEEVDRYADGGLDEGQRLRDFYRDIVLGSGEINQTYDRILKQYGEAKFDEATAFLIAGIGAEIHAQSRSRDPERLHALVNDLYYVQVARNTHRQFDGLLARIKDVFGVTPAGTGHTLMKHVLPLKDQRWIDPTAVLGAVDDLRIAGPEPRIYFLRELHALVGKLPVKVFPGLDDRGRVLDALQQTLDATIEAEA
jgi:type III secretion system YopN/LcrE/InvE/MxiC family regulator